MVTSENCATLKAEHAGSAAGGDDPASTKGLQDSDYFSDCEPELCLESGYGVPIVWPCGRGESGQQFRVDAAALAALVARAGAGRRVALVGVAGACRGGKSFLLGYMLRYLYALAQADEEPAGEEWLGGPEEPLHGFPWRGGCKRETTGIMLWSQPFPVTLPDGEKVAVLLMDTQGSFDDQSSLRDCSLIFALSTLLASTQVYNISQRIKEDDLQHLQLFAEYAAAGGSGLAALQLLLRDWSAPYEHPYGADGGASYLRDKLKVKDEQPHEVRDLRQRLADSFKDMSCFLMPHPGRRAATHPGFQGKLSELTEDFKRSLRELVPLLLAPARLRVKCIGGRALAACELPVLLQTYFDEFSENVPSPSTVLNATARVAWLCGREAARARVSAAAPTRAVPRAELLARLTAAARDALLPLPPLADRANDRDGLADFEKELDALVEQYAEVNDCRMNLALASAKASFERAVRELEQQGLCWHPLDLPVAIAEAREAAMAHFEYNDNGVADPDITQLTMYLEERSAAVLERLSAVNDANNLSAVEAACAAARGALERALPRSCAGAGDLASAHSATLQHAVQIFQEHRNRNTSHEQDEYIIQMERNMQLYLSIHTEQNAKNNKEAQNKALVTYEKRINFNDGFWRPDLLAAKHEEVKRLVINSFFNCRDGNNSRERDEFVVELESQLLDCYKRLRKTNEELNESEVDFVYNKYCRKMDELCRGLRWEDSDLCTQMQDACLEGQNKFMSGRVTGPLLPDDSEEDLYLQSLVEKMEGKFEYYHQKNNKNLSGLEVTGVVVGSVVLVGGVVVGAVVVATSAAASAPAVVTAAVETGINTVIPAACGVAGVVFKFMRRPL